jgi:hypothetical protein
MQRQLWSVAALATTLLVSYSAPEAQTPVTLSACAKLPNGELRLVASSVSCAAGEIRITWNTQGPAGPPGPGAMRIVDSGNKTLGTYLGNGSILTNLFGVPAVLRASAEGFSAGVFINVRFHHTTADCSGTRYVAMDEWYRDNFLPPLVQLVPQSGKLLLPYPAASNFHPTFNSTETFDINQDATQPGSCQASPNYTQYVGAGYAVLFDASLLGYTPPFRLVY